MTRRGGWAVTLLCIAALGPALLPSLLWPSRARAYLDGRTFEDDALSGGGGGRLFSGAPRDGYTCAVCHAGGAALALSVDGVPADGWEPGQTYELRIAVPSETRNLGAIVEIADAEGRGAGTLDVLGDASLTDEDQCRGGTGPAAHAIDAEGRTLARLDVCGARRVAVRWTAPPAPVPSVRVFASVVAGDGSGDPSGDTAGHVAASLRARGEPELEGARLHGGCSVATSREGAARWLAIGWLAVALLAFVRRRR